MSGMVTFYPVYSEKENFKVDVWARRHNLDSFAKYALEVIPHHYIVSNKPFSRTEAEHLIVQIGSRDRNPSSWHEN